MNRAKRDYCSKGHHPRWKAWKTRYDMSSPSWNMLGDFCIYCGAPVIDSVATPCPADLARMRGLKGGCVSSEDYEARKRGNGAYLSATRKLSARHETAPARIEQ